VGAKTRRQVQEFTVISSRRKGGHMLIDYHKHLKSHGRILAFFIGACIIVGTLVFLLPGADRDLASAGQERLNAQTAGRDRDEEQARKDERDKRRPDHFVRSRPENVVWGGFPINRRAVLTMQSGQTVRIDALSQSGATGTITPVGFFGLFGVGPKEVLPDLVDFWKTIPTTGTIPNVRQHLYRATKMRGRDVAVVADGVQVPLARSWA
jgi:hypothetical protein